MELPHFSLLKLALVRVFAMKTVQISSFTVNDIFNQLGLMWLMRMQVRFFRACYSNIPTGHRVL